MLFPNPATDYVSISISNLDYQVFDHYGRVVMSGLSDSELIDISELSSGVYTIKIEGGTVHKLVKN